MSRGYLSNYFQAFAFKRLSSVETNPAVSHQHEFNGILGLRNMFGGDEKKLNAKVFYFGDDESDNLATETNLTWYDARKNHPTRSEYRLFYSNDIFYDVAQEGDLLVIAKRSNELFYIIVAKAGSSFESNLLWLFDIRPEDITNEFFSNQIDNKEINYAIKIILSELGIEVIEPDDDYLDSILNRFGETFPSTFEFSDFARREISSDLSEPDDFLIDCIEKEEVLFRTLEEYLLKKKISAGFESVNDFISYSLSVQNRRKSRAGFALENHVEFIFKKYSINYSRGKITENYSRPDFIFPGIDQYHNNDFPSSNLSMLGVKSTCKDRWRQILAEAKRIDKKHLLTLEPGISNNQTDEMKANKVQLIVPKVLLSTYTESQKRYILNFKSFIQTIQELQKEI